MFANQHAMETAAFQKYQEAQQQHSMQSIGVVSRQLTSNVNPAVMQELVNMVTDFHDRTAAYVRDAWWNFFYSMVGKFRDIYIVENPNADSFSTAFRFMSISRPMLENMGFWGVPGTPPHDKATPLPVVPINVPTYETVEEYQRALPHGPFAPYEVPTIFAISAGSTDMDKGTDDTMFDGQKKGPHHGKTSDTAVPTMAPTFIGYDNNSGRKNSTSESTTTVSLKAFYGSLTAATLVGAIVGGVAMWWFSKRSDYVPLR